MEDHVDPYPMVWIESDNTTSEAWSPKGCKDSLGGDVLGNIHSTLLLGNRVGLQVAHIPTTANVIADHISHILHAADISTVFSSFQQDHTVLCGHQQFNPDAEFISEIMAALFNHACPHPVALSRQALTNPCYFSS